MAEDGIDRRVIGAGDLHGTTGTAEGLDGDINQSVATVGNRNLDDGRGGKRAAHPLGHCGGGLASGQASLEGIRCDDDFHPFLTRRCRRDVLDRPAMLPARSAP